jgi:hypothetical protein
MGYSSGEDFLAANGETGGFGWRLHYFRRRDQE